MSPDITITISSDELDNMIGCISCFIGDRESPLDKCRKEKALLKKLKASRRG
jgi:hypothetical protein